MAANDVEQTAQLAIGGCAGVSDVYNLSECRRLHGYSSRLVSSSSWHIAHPASNWRFASRAGSPTLRYGIACRVPTCDHPDEVVCFVGRWRTMMNRCCDASRTAPLPLRPGHVGGNSQQRCLGEYLCLHTFAPHRGLMGVTYVRQVAHY